MRPGKDNEIYTLRMKYQRTGITDIDGLNNDVGRILANKKPTEYELNIIGSIFEYVSENIERDSIKHRSADEWRELERRYIVKSDFTLPDLVDYLLRRLEKKRITREQLEQQRKQFKPCKHRFCLNYFTPHRKNAIYCSRDCKEKERDARKEYERTSKMFDNGTYLPPSAYKFSHQVDKEREYKKRERLFEPEALNLILANTELEEFENEGKRDRTVEERKLRSWRIDEEVKGGQTPVKYEKTGEKPVKKII